MHSHNTRTILIAVAFVVVLGTVLTMYLTGTSESAEGLVERLEGMLVILAPALLDSLRVKLRGGPSERATETPPSDS